MRIKPNKTIEDREVNLPDENGGVEGAPEVVPDGFPEITVGDIGVTSKEAEKFRDEQMSAGEPKKPRSKLAGCLIYGVIGFVGLIIVVVVIGLLSGGKEEPKNPPTTEINNVDKTVDPIPDTVEPTPDIPEEEPVELVADPTVEKEGFTRYTNEYLGVSMLYPSYMYIEEHTDLQVNLLSELQSSQEIVDLSTLDLSSLSSSIPVVDFLFKDDLDSRISVVRLGGATVPEAKPTPIPKATATPLDKKGSTRGKEEQTTEFPSVEGVRFPVDFKTFNTEYYLLHKKYLFDREIAYSLYKNKKGSEFTFPEFEYKLEDFESDLVPLVIDGAKVETFTYETLGVNYLEYIISSGDLVITYSHILSLDKPTEDIASIVTTLIESYKETRSEINK